MQSADGAEKAVEIALVITERSTEESEEQVYCEPRDRSELCLKRGEKAIRKRRQIECAV
jgi:hypothetical protein